jgi:hypothetical protein
VDVDRVAQRRRPARQAAQELAVRDHDPQLAARGLDRLGAGLAGSSLGLEDLRTQALGGFLDRVRARRSRAAAGPVGVGDDQRHLVPAGHQGLERGDGEGVAAEEGDPHA